MKRFSTVTIVLALLASSSVAHAQSTFTYQGKLTNLGVAETGPIDLAIRLYDDVSAGLQIGSELALPAFVGFDADGLFAVDLDFGAGAFTGAARWLEIWVDGAPLTPRQPIHATPYAMHAMNVADSAVPFIYSGANAVFDNGNVGIGTTTPEGPLHVMEGSAGAVTGHFNSSAIFERSSTNYLSILSPDTTERGLLFGDPESFVNGGIIYNNPSAPDGFLFRTGGNFNRMTITSNGDVGIGTTAPDDDLHVVGSMRSIANTTGQAIYGLNNGGLPGHGVRGDTFSTGGAGIYGWARASSGSTSGVYGASDSPSGIGVKGFASSTTGTTYAVKGTAYSGSGRGVYGEAYGSGIGVYGRASGNSGINYALFGYTSSSTGYGMYSIGKAHVAGTLSKNAGAFRIDHPLDPANKELWHSFVESPDMMNIYNGNVVTDGEGYATVTMPEWFEALNRDFRYQLTVIDEADSADFIFAKVVQKIASNQFAIRTSQPWTEVSWMVTGVRQDPWAEANRIPTEVEKREEDKGLYLTPEAYGLPREMGVDWQNTEPGERHPVLGERNPDPNIEENQP